jgi:hypothetical protein
MARIPLPLFDKLGRSINLNDKVVRALSYSPGDIEICTVTRIENGKCYLDNSKVAINYPRRLLVVNASV